MDYARTVLSQALAACALCAGAITIPFEMPYDGKATVMLDDASGRRVRNLVNGLPFAKGPQSVEWDGRAEDGTGAAGGRYVVRVVTHPGVSYTHLDSFAAGGEKLFSGFGPNHLPCTMSLGGGDRMAFASLFTEGGNSTLVLGLDGKLLHGWGEGWNLGNRACVYLAGGGGRFYSLREKENNELQFMGYSWEGRQRPRTRIESSRPTRLAGAVALGAEVFVANGLGDTIDVYAVAERDGESVLSFTGRSEPCGKAGPLCAAGGRVISAIKPGQRSIASDGELLYAIEEGSHCVHVYDLATRAELRTIGEEGGAYAGPWRKDRLVNPTSCALDGQGFLWVTEDRFNPKRISRWDVKRGVCVYEKIGSERYGSPGGGMDGEDATRWMAHDTEWRYDPAAGVDRPVAVSHDESREQGPDRSLPPHTARTYRWVHRGGRTYVIGVDSSTMFWEYVESERRLKPIGMIGSSGLYAHVAGRDPAKACRPMVAAYGRAFPQFSGDRLVEECIHDEDTLMFWADRDGDERFDADEIEFAPRHTGGGGYWGFFPTGLDFTVCLFSEGEYYLLDMKYPEWSLAKAWGARRKVKGNFPAGAVHQPRAEQYSSPAGRVVCTGASPFMTGIGADGALSWCLRNQFVGVHGSQKAGLPRPGELQGVLFAMGQVPGGRDGRLEVMAIKNNHGRVFFITTDGVYLDEAFTDCRVAAANDETYVGGESFGGSFEYDRKGRRALLASGAGGYRLYEIKGLDQVDDRRVPRTFTDREIVEAQQKFPAAGAARRVRPALVVPLSGGPARVAEWDSGDWRIRLDAVVAGDRLRLRYEVEEPSPWVNNGTDRFEMFKTGDCVDFQFLRGKAPVRVMLYPEGGGAGAVVYDFEGALGAGGEAHKFASPWRSFEAKAVFFPKDLGAEVKRHNDHRYTVEFSVPCAWLSASGRLPAALECDFGVIFGDRDGTINQSRVYWANKETGLVNDVPGEIMPDPRNWGTARFGGDSAAASADAPVAKAPAAASLRALPPILNARGVVASPSRYAVGPVYDAAKRRLYYSTGRGEISSVTPSGGGQLRYRLPGAREFGRFDTMVIGPAGELYVLADGNSARNPAHAPKDAGRLYRLVPGADGAEGECIAEGVCAIAQHLRGDELACMMPDSSVRLFNVRTRESRPFGPPVRNGSEYPCMLDWLPDGRLMAVVEHWYYHLYSEGSVTPAKRLFGEREIRMERGKVVGDWLWVLTESTIKRYDARTLKPAPGVVYGGASGYFIGHVRTNHEMRSAGICEVADGVVAVLATDNSAIYFFRYNPATWGLDEIRRNGGVVDPDSLVVDGDGFLMVDGLCWPFDADPNRAPDTVQVRFPLRGAALLPDGRTLYVNETHGANLDFRIGRLADGELRKLSDGDSRPYPEGRSNPQKWGEARAQCSFARRVKGGFELCSLLKDGRVKCYLVGAAGHPLPEGSCYRETRLERPAGAEGGCFLSAAPLPDGSLAVSVDGAVHRYAPDGEAGWRPGAPLGIRADSVAADGPLLATAEAEAGAVRVYAVDGAAPRKLAEAGGLAAPARVAMKGGRLAVWERNAQRVARFTLENR